MSECRVGAVVELNSGGPPMVVTTPPRQSQYEGRELVMCEWFNNNNELLRDDFYTDCVKPWAGKPDA